MGFMKMLAQNTQIDGRSRWDEAERTLRDDARFKAVPDSSDREDLFNEFVEALTKKEKVNKCRALFVCVWELFFRLCSVAAQFFFYPRLGVSRTRTRYPVVRLSDFCNHARISFANVRI